jgi:hypothetical protein
MALMQAERLLAEIDKHGSDLDAVRDSFDEWCTEAIAPWVQDHIDMDSTRLRRWGGAEIDLARPLPSDLVLAAASQEPGIARAMQPYLSMDAGPASLDALQGAARRVFETGWRPAYSAGPTRDELARIVSSFA